MIPRCCPYSCCSTRPMNTTGKRGCYIHRCSHSPCHSGIDMPDRRPQPPMSCDHELVLCTAPLRNFHAAVTANIVNARIYCLDSIFADALLRFSHRVYRYVHSGAAQPGRIAPIRSFSANPRLVVIAFPGWAIQQIYGPSSVKCPSMGAQQTFIPPASNDSVQPSSDLGVQPRSGYLPEADTCWASSIERSCPQLRYMPKFTIVRVWTYHLKNSWKNRISYGHSLNREKAISFKALRPCPQCTTTRVNVCRRHRVLCQLPEVF